MSGAWGQASAEGDGETGTVSVVVPVFNSEQTIDELCERLQEVLSRGPADWELILVNDGSGDGSWSVIERRSAREPNVRGVNLTRNFGQHNALLAGIDSAGGELIVTLDDDLQNPPEEIPALLAALSPGVDVVYGTPIEYRQRPVRRVGAGAVRRLAKLLSRGRIPLEVSTFRLFRARLLEDLSRPHLGARISLDSLISRSARGIASAEVRHDSRRCGESNYSMGTLARHAVTVIAASLAPLPRRRGRPSYEIGLETPAPEGRDARQP